MYALIFHSCRICSQRSLVDTLLADTIGVPQTVNELPNTIRHVSVLQGTLIFVFLPLKIKIKIIFPLHGPRIR